MRKALRTVHTARGSALTVLVALAMIMVLAMALPVFAADSSAASLSADSSETLKSTDVYKKKNEETGNLAVIVDSAHLLSDEEEVQLEKYLDQVTAYCDALFLTIDEPHSSSTHEYAKSKLEQIGRSVGMTDGHNSIIYVIDMNKRQLTIYAGDTAAKTITTAVSTAITDNTYTYATKGDYYAAARETFIQIFQVLEGQEIAQPMRYITSALLALFIGFGISLIAVRTKTKRRKADERSIMDSLETSYFEPAVSATLVSEKTVTHVESSGGGGGFSGGGGGGGFSGGGGGGGFSGGGSSGSHGF